MPTAILYYALNDDDEDDAGLSSGSGTNLKVGGTCQARSAGKFFVVPSTFFGFTSTIIRFGKLFRVVSTVWSLSCFLFFLLSVPRAQSFVIVWARALVLWMELASLLCYSFTPESIMKLHSIWMHSVTRAIFPVFAFKVTHRVILLTRFCKLLTRVATLSGGHVPRVPQWHDASARTFKCLNLRSSLDGAGGCCCCAWRCLPWWSIAANCCARTRPTASSWCCAWCRRSQLCAQPRPWPRPLVDGAPKTSVTTHDRLPCNSRAVRPNS